MTDVSFAAPLDLNEVPLPAAPAASPAPAANGLAIAALPLGPESLLIRNTVAVAAGARHPEAAQRLFEFLQRREIAQQLAAMNALEGISTSEVSTPTLEVKWDPLLGDLGAATETLKQIFLR